MTKKTTVEPIKLGPPKSLTEDIKKALREKEKREKREKKEQPNPQQ